MMYQADPLWEAAPGSVRTLCALEEWGSGNERRNSRLMKNSN